MAFALWSVDAGSAVVAATCNEPGPVLISLQAIQEKFGYVPIQAIEIVAKACNVSRAEVHGVLTFYHDLRTTPPPRTSIHICVAEACQAVGSRTLIEEVEESFDAKMSQTGAEVEISPVYCLGNCALGPSASIDGRLIGRATVEALKAFSETGIHR